MSKFLKFAPITLNNGNKLCLRLSAPFPKVEPPDINPKFESDLLKTLELEEIEKKPEAPWILREDNAVKFTDKVEKYSNLDINFS